MLVASNVNHGSYAFKASGNSSAKAYKHTWAGCFQRKVEIWVAQLRFATKTDRPLLNAFVKLTCAACAACSVSSMLKPCCQKLGSS